MSNSAHPAATFKNIYSNYFLNFLAPFTERVDDTYLAVGSEAYAAARVFYYSAKGAAKANVPGADAIVEELAKRYNPRAQSEEKEKAA